MPVHRRAHRRLLVFILAVPIVALVYLTTFGLRIWSAFRPIVAAMLGVTVISSVYADEAVRRVPLGPARMSPLKAAAVAALAIMLVTSGMAPAPTLAAEPNEAVVNAARDYLGANYMLGGEGPGRFDCSGLIYRAFLDAGELPRVGGRRLRAAGYMKWFASRGQTSKTDGKRGDLVVYGGGRHIGIYLGDDKVLSALTEGVSIHPLKGISYRFNFFLRVDWSVGDGGAGNGGNDGKGDPDKDKDKDEDKAPDVKPDRNIRANAGNEAQVVRPDNDDGASAGNDNQNARQALAVGTMNVRKGPSPDERIVGWVSRGTTFKILAEGRSSGGALWFNVESRSGRTGWVWSGWARPLD